MIIHYKCYDDKNDKIDDSSLTNGFKVPANHFIYQKIRNLAVGDKKTFTIPYDQAYGPRYEVLIQKIPRQDLPEDYEPVQGQRIHLQKADAGWIDVLITAFTEDSITIDANHELAGIALTFKVERME